MNRLLQKILILTLFVQIFTVKVNAQVTWTQMADCPTVPADFTFSIGNIGYMGYSHASPLSACASMNVISLWEYNTVTGAWTQGPDEPCVYSSNQLILGGLGFALDTVGYICIPNNTSFGSYCCKFHPSTNSWSAMALCPFTTLLFDSKISMAINGKGYIFASKNQIGGGSITEVWEYNSITNLWTQKNSFSDYAYPVFGIPLNSKAYIMSTNNSTNGNQFWMYSPSSDSWTINYSTLPFGTGYATFGFSIENLGYIGTQDSISNGTSPGNVVFFEFNPITNIINNINGTNTFTYPLSASHEAFSICSAGYAKFNESGHNFWKLNSNLNTVTQNKFICSGYSLVVGSHSYSTSGTYTDIFSSFNGCDSTVITNLSVNDTSVSVLNNVLTANQTSATYQWVDCNNGNSAIAGGTNQNYTVTSNGSYAVIVSVGNCSDMSSCYNFNNLGISEYAISSVFSITPNPFTSQTTITFSTEQHNSIIKVTDILGKQIKTIRFSGKQYILEKGEMDAGIYFISVNSEQGIVNKKIIIQ